MNTWWILYSLVGVVWFIGNAIVIIMQRRPAASTIAWLLALVFLPVVGFLLYVLIGPLRLERRKRKHTISKRLAEEGLRGMAALHQRDEEHHQLANVSIAVGGSPPLEAESVEIYFDGAATYKAILDAIAAAKDHVHVEYYIWEADKIGTRLRDALIERARAGVTVRVILDGTGSRLSKKFLRPLREAGASVGWFNPVHLWSIRRRRIDFRSHRKIVVCDGRIGFTGGMNVSDQHSAEFSKESWRDTHLRVTGTAVWPMQRLFFEDWYYVADVSKFAVPTMATSSSHSIVYRSFRLDFELAAILFGEAENRLLADSFELDVTASRELIAADLAAQSFGQRLGQSAARLLSPLL